MTKALENNEFQINAEKIKNFLTLCKLRVNSLIVFTAVIGMFLSTPGMVPWDILFSGILGIGFVAAAAAAFNCLIEESIDKKMARTRARPLGTGKINQQETLVLASIVGLTGISSPVLFCKLPYNVAHVNNFFCLRGNLHSILKTCYTHEYSNWRGLWSNAACIRLGCSEQPTFT
jgi:heme O synthase-like polyprenyltransferase